MSIPNLKKDFTLGSLINSFLYIILGILALIGFWLILFIYNNFYTTIGRAETILILKSELAVDVLDVSLYDKIKKDLNLLAPYTSSESASASSTNPLLPQNLPNPFLAKP